MKTEAQVRHKLQQVKFRHLKREIRTGMSRKPCNCENNGLVNMENGSTMGICLLGAGQSGYWQGILCDESRGGLRVAETCPNFNAIRTPTEIRSEFDTFLKSNNRAVVAEKYPDVAALLWVLEEEVDVTGAEDLEVPAVTNGKVEVEVKTLPSPYGSNE